MAELSESEKRQIIERLDKMSQSQRETILANDNNFEDWLKKTLRWIWEKVKEILRDIPIVGPILELLGII